MSNSVAAHPKPRIRFTFWHGITLGAVLIFVLFLIYPLARLLLSSMASDTDVALKTYLDFFTKRYYYETLLHSLVASVLAVVMATLIGAPLGYVVNRFNIPGKSFLRAAIVLTFVSPPFIGAYAWVLLLGNNGWVTKALAAAGVSMPSIYGLSGMVLVFTLQAMPFMFLMVGSGLKSVDQSVEDASTNLGRRPFGAVISAIAPLMIPAISTGALLVFVTSFSDIGTPQILGGDYRMLATLIYSEFNSEHGGTPVAASSLAFIMLVVTIGALLVQRSFSKRRSFGQETVNPLRPIRLRGWKRFAASVFSYVVVLLSGLPLLTIVIASFLRSRGPLLVAEFTLDGYRDATRLSRALFNTLTFSAISTLIAVAIGCLVGYVVTRQRTRLAGLVDAFSMVPFAVAGVVMGIALSVTFGDAPLFLAGTPVILILAYFIRRLPYSVRSVSGMLSQMGNQTEEASVNLGVSPAQTYLRVTIPMISPAILSGALLTFATIVREFNATVILYSGRTATLPVEVFAQVLQGNFGQAAVIGTVLIAISVVPIVILFKFMGKGEDVLI